MKPAQIFDRSLNTANFYSIFSEYIEDKATVGKDGVNVDNFIANKVKEVEVALRKIKAGTYCFTTYKEKLILKGANSAPRQVSIPTIRDKLVLKVVSETLNQIYPELVSRPPHGIVKKFHKLSETAKIKIPDAHYLRLDIESYYPTINHKILMRVLRRKIRKKQLLHLIEAAIKTPTGNKIGMDGSISENLQGVPQGLSISNILSSIYFEELDAILNSEPDCHYDRFVDDILIIADKPVAERLSLEIPRLLKQKRKLVCHKVGESSKSTLVPISAGVDYLGYTFRGQRLSVKDTSFKKMFTNLFNLFTGMKYRRNKTALIWRMNLRITGCIFQGRRVGWVFYFSQSNYWQQPKQLDEFIKKNAPKFLSASEVKSLKSFVRAFREVKHNFLKSSYFPNFDDFTIEKKKDELRLLLPVAKTKDLESKSDKEINKLFNMTISREVKEIEKDMGDGSSRR